MPCVQTCLSLSRSIKSRGYVKGLALAVSREGATPGTVDTRDYLSRHAALAVKEGFRKLLKKQEEQ